MSTAPAATPTQRPPPPRHGRNPDCGDIDIVIITWAGIVSIYCLSVLSRFIYQVACNSDSKEVKKLSKVMKIIPILVILFFFLDVGSSIAYNLFYCFDAHTISPKYNISVGFYGCALHALVVIFIYRLSTIVEGSHVFTKCGQRTIFIFAWTLWTLSVGCMIFSISSYFSKTELSLRFFLISSVVYAVLSVSTLTMFIYCLHRLARAMNYSDNAKTKRRLVKLVESMTKYCICVVCGLISSLICAFLFGVIRIDGNVTWSTDAFVNTTCLYLQFNFANAKSIYNCLCKPCHRCVQSCFWGNIEKSLLYDDAHKDTITNEFAEAHTSSYSNKDNEMSRTISNSERVNGANLYKFSTDVSNTKSIKNHRNDNDNDEKKNKRNPNSYVPPPSVQLQISQMDENAFD